jgi:hypothetical protein
MERWMTDLLEAPAFALHPCLESTIIRQVRKLRGTPGKIVKMPAEGILNAQLKVQLKPARMPVSFASCRAFSPSLKFLRMSSKARSPNQ